MTRVLVTGATGLVGRTLCHALAGAGYVVRAALRGDLVLPTGAAERVRVGNIAAHTDWSQALAGVDCVVHLAARAHVLNDEPAHADLYLETNTRGTEALTSAAAESGVRRLIFMSSIKVNGEETKGNAFTSSDVPCPRDPYGQSKWLAEQSLTEIATKTGMAAVIVRAPLVYGPQVKGNFLRLMRWVDKGWPLPLGSVENRRSLVNVWNLSDLVLRLLNHPGAPGRTWMVSDGEDLSTPGLIRRLGAAMDRRVRLIPVPVRALRWCGSLMRRRMEIERLCGSLAVDIAPTCRELDWSPPMTVDEGLARAAKWYRSGVESRVD